MRLISPCRTHYKYIFWSSHFLDYIEIIMYRRYSIVKNGLIYNLESVLNFFFTSVLQYKMYISRRGHGLWGNSVFSAGLVQNFQLEIRDLLRIQFEVSDIGHSTYSVKSESNDSEALS